MRIKAFISVSLLLLLLVCAVPAYAIPALPHAFYGTLLINGSPAPAGTQVRVTGTGVTTDVPQNPLTTTAAGQYGNGGVYLLVQGDILDGATITFWINGVFTGQTATWHSGETTELNLSANIEQGGGGGGIGSGILLTTTMFGSMGFFTLTTAGIALNAITIASADGKMAITIPAGTKLLDKDGHPLTAMTADVFANPPAPPENANIIGLAYTFGPAGATFVPPLTLTMTYDPAALPAGITEADLDIAYYDTATGAWVTLHGTVNTTNHTITALVSHFTTFAVIGTTAPAAFTLSSLVVSPLQVASGETVTISLTLANTGGLQGTYTVVLNVNDAKETEKSITVAAHSTQAVSFSVAKTAAGAYSVTVGGLSGSFTVLAPPPTTTPPATTPPVVIPTTTPPATTAPAITPPAITTPAATGKGFNWTLVGGIIGGVIIVVLVIVLFARRRD